MPVVRKSEFADMCDVTKGRVTQWISDGQISGAAIVGEGRTAMIDSEIALAQLKERLGSERFGENGLNTNLDDTVRRPRARAAARQVTSEDAAPHFRIPPAPQARESEDPDTVEARLKAEKLKQARVPDPQARTGRTDRHGNL